MWKVWMEWDYGQDCFVFSTLFQAQQWAKKTAERIQEEFWDEEEKVKWTYQNLIDEGLMGFEKLTLDP